MCEGIPNQRRKESLAVTTSNDKRLICVILLTRDIGYYFPAAAGAEVILTAREPEKTAGGMTGIHSIRHRCCGLTLERGIVEWAKGERVFIEAGKGNLKGS
jgi:hypothetical protein